MDVADVDPVERRVEQIQKPKRGCGGRGAESPRRVAEDEERAGPENHRLGDQEHRGPRHDPHERREQIEHERQVLSPEVHGGQGRVRAVARGDAPDHLQVLPEVQRVGAKGEVSGEHDESHHDGIAKDTRGHRSRARRGGPRERRQEAAQRHDRRQEHDEILGARQRKPGDGPSSRREHRGQEQHDTERRGLERAGQARQGRRVYLARRLSKRRERRRPRLFKTNQKSTERIRRP